MNLRNALVVALVAPLLTLGATRVPSQPRPAVGAAKVVNTCIVEATLYEDGSWAGGRLIYNGKTIWNDWTRVMPRTGWLPGYRGTVCKFVLNVPVVAR